MEYIGKDWNFVVPDTALTQHTKFGPLDVITDAIAIPISPDGKCRVDEEKVALLCAEAVSYDAVKNRMPLQSGEVVVVRVPQPVHGLFQSGTVILVSDDLKTPVVDLLRPVLQEADRQKTEWICLPSSPAETEGALQSFGDEDLEHVNRIRLFEDTSYSFSPREAQV